MEKKDSLPLGLPMTLGAVDCSFLQSRDVALLDREKERYFEDESLEKDGALSVNGSKS